VYTCITCLSHKTLRVRTNGAYLPTAHSTREGLSSLPPALRCRRWLACLERNDDSDEYDDDDDGDEYDDEYDEEEEQGNDDDNDYIAQHIISSYPIEQLQAQWVGQGR